MTLIASILFIATLLLSTHAVLSTTLKAMPRIEQVITERSGMPPRSRIIRVKAVRSSSSRSTNVVAFAPRKGPALTPQNPLLLAA